MTARRSDRGVTLVQCLLLMILIALLGPAMFHLLDTNRRLAVQSVRTRSAEALADGGLELALAHLQTGGGPEHLGAELPTGWSRAVVEVGSSTQEYVIRYSGEAQAEGKLKAERNYRATAARAEDGTWKAHGIREIPTSKNRS